jgi:hypothetical protein
MLALERENAEKTQALKAARAAEVQVLELQRKLREQQEEQESLIQRKILESRTDVEAHVRKLEHERHELKEREWQQKFDALTRQAEELKRQAEQGSQQLAGEVQELVIEEYLRAAFPHDEVVEIRKGAAGADCVHHVISGSRRMGSILYESKRTKRFEPAWIEKFKEDVRQQGAEVGVLVSESLPKDVTSFTLINGVFVCGFAQFKALAHAAREMVLRVGMASGAQEHRGDKMSMLYEYLTGSEFRLNIEAIVEGFEAMRNDLARERTAMERLWKQREKQLEKVIFSTAGMYGSIKGIAGADVADVTRLELGSTRSAEPERLDAE